MPNLLPSRTTYCVLAAAVVLASVPVSRGQVLEYSEDFSTDPGWITDQPQNYFWDAATMTYRATTVNTHGGQPSPTRYSYTAVDYGGRSARLEFDVRFDSIGWSSGVMFGLFDERLNLWPSPIAPDADSMFASFGRADGGMGITLYVCDAATGCMIDQVYNVTSDNTWYRCVVTYDATALIATMTLTDLTTAAVVADLSVANFPQLKPELDYLGFARDPNGNECCPSCSGYSCSESATATIDNVQFFEENASDLQYACRIVRDAGVLGEGPQLPDTLAQVGAGREFTVEFWATDSGDVNSGITSAYADLDYPETMMTCEGTTPTALFPLFPGGGCSEPPDFVDEWGGSQLNPDIGVEPNWARVSTAGFTADAVGTAEFCLTPATTESAGHGRGTVPPEAINYGCCSVEIVCPCIYDLDDNCNVSGGDLGLFAPCWNVCDTDSEWIDSACAARDFDVSGCVSGGDLSWFAAGWGKTCDLIDPIGDYPIERQCAPITCPLAPPITGSAAATQPLSEALDGDGPVLLELRLRADRYDATSERSLTNGGVGRVLAGDRVFADVWAIDTRRESKGLTVVYADVDYDHNAFELVSLEPASPFRLFSDEAYVTDDGVARVGGATLAADVGANTWVRVATIEFKATGNPVRPAFSLSASEGESVSRYGAGLVPPEQVHVISRSADRRSKTDRTVSTK